MAIISMEICPDLNSIPRSGTLEKKEFSPSRKFSKNPNFPKIATLIEGVGGGPPLALAVEVGEELLLVVAEVLPARRGVLLLPGHRTKGRLQETRQECIAARPKSTGA